MIEIAEYKRSKNCKFCNKEFISTSPKKLYCSSFHIVPCFICGTLTEKSTKAIIKDPYQTCSKECSKEKTKRTNLERYGVEYPLQSKDIHEKTIETLKENLKDPEFKQLRENKMKATMLEKYNTENAFKKDSPIRIAFEERLLNEYGVKNIGGIPESLEKVKRTSLRKYGVEWTGQLERIRKINQERLLDKEVQNNMKQAFYEKYGARNPGEIEEFKLKTFSTFYKNRGINKSEEFFQLDQWIKENPELTIKKIANYFDLPIKDIKARISKKKLQNEFSDFYNLTTPEYLFYIELLDFLEEKDIFIHQRNVIPPFELDFVIPSLNIAIEINPTWTHKYNEDPNIIGPTSKNYHYEKFRRCKEIGLELISIFDWIETEKIIKFIKSKIIKETNRIYARETKINISPKITKDHRKFLSENHLLGPINNKGNSFVIELLYNDELVGFGVFYPSNKKETIELKRLSYKDNIVVIGGASKILKNALSYSPDYQEIITYSDNNFGTGNVYNRIGFSEIETKKNSLIWSAPKYNKYIKDYSLALIGADKLLKDIPNYIPIGTGENLPSNRDIIQSYGFLPVYDCGYTKWIYKK